MVLAMLPTLDESGMAIRQTGSQDPPPRDPDLRCTGWSSPARQCGPSANPTAAPSPLDKGKGAASSASAPAAAGTAPPASHILARGPTAAALALGTAAAEEVPARGPAPAPDTEGDLGGASSSVPPPTPEVVEDRKDYKSDLQKVFARELEASRQEKMLAKREEALSQREALTTEIWAKLNALD
eukprot:XP_008657743.1 atherin-like [Zea mays]